MNSSDVDGFILKRLEQTSAFIERFSQAFIKNLVGDELEELLGAHTCFYAVGSAGRGEISAHSDLDVFLVRDHTKLVSRMDEVRLQAAIVRASRELKLPDPSNDAFYLKLHSANELIERLGQPSDDSQNTFTVRMLLLLESRPIGDATVYNRLLKSSLEPYWKYAIHHKDHHLPIVLTNDIVRYWRNLLLNYESKTAEKERDLLRMALGDVPPESMRKLEANRWVRSFKLRFSRCLTCYSAVVYLLAVAANTLQATGKAHVDRDAVNMLVSLRPLERLRAITALCPRLEVSLLVESLRQLYAEFLEQTERPKGELEEAMQDEEKRAVIMGPAYEFGEKMFELTATLGVSNPLYRYVVV